MFRNLTVILALAFCVFASQSLAQDKYEGELPVESELPLVGRKALPSMKEIEAKLANSRPVMLFVARLAVETTNIYAPTWASTKSGLTFSYQRSDIKNKQSKVFVKPKLAVSGTSAIADEYSFESSMSWGRRVDPALFPRTKKQRFPYVLLSNVTGFTQIHAGLYPGDEPFRVSESEASKRSPVLRVFPTGTVDMIYDAGEELVWTRLNQLTESSVETAVTKKIAQGTQASFRPDGKAITFVREIYGSGRDANKLLKQEIVILDHNFNVPIVIAQSKLGEVFRSPVYSPNGKLLAWYVRRPGDDTVWDLHTCDVTSQLNKVQVAAKSVVVQGLFEYVRPAFTSDGTSVVYFSNNHREEEYYPILRSDLNSGKTVQVDYPKAINVANDITLREWSSGYLVLFTGIDRGPRELFVGLILKNSEKAKSGKK